MPITLAIESSQRENGVALRDAVGAIQIEPLRTDVRLDEDLMPAIDRVVRRAGLAPGDLELVGISIGPGGFTGLRIAVTTARLFAEVLGVKLAAVESALVAANSGLEESSGRLLVTSAAKRDQVWVTRMRPVKPAREPPGSHAIRYEIDATVGLRAASEVDLAGVSALLGDRFLPDALRARCAEAGVRVIEPRYDPAVCLNLSEWKAARGELTDPLKLMPLYAREPEAVRLHRDR